MDLCFGKRPIKSYNNVSRWPPLHSIIWLDQPGLSDTTEQARNKINWELKKTKILAYWEMGMFLMSICTQMKRPKFLIAPNDGENPTPVWVNKTDFESAEMTKC